MEKTKSILGELFSWAHLPLPADLRVYHVNELFYRISQELPRAAMLPSRYKK